MNLEGGGWYLDFPNGTMLEEEATLIEKCK
jgi:hypothetical protein